ncbi:MAG: hypothetical protein CW691_00270 [Candidatus Bathyarchaeum sp.]|nr:MAG: hypothetical protein CW691_00270 [Candidatus Bathyarchaeum sp.]
MLQMLISVMHKLLEDSETNLKPMGKAHKLFVFFLVALLCTVIFSSSASNVLAQETVESDPEYFMGILILESEQQAILNSINKVKELQLGNMVILHPMDQAWNPTLIEEAIREADNLELYVIFETFNFSDHEIRISPEQFSSWQTKYPHLLGILVQEIAGKQVDLNLWLNNTTNQIDTRLEVEEAVIENITSSMQLAEFKDSGARIFLQENVISYASANTSHCDVLVSKIFNAPNTELMIGLTRGMCNSYDIPAWGLWVDTWREWIKPPADFTPSDVEDALYEGWFYGAKYFFFEQGNFFGTLDRDWPHKYIILGEDGKLTEYGKVIQKFYAFLQNEQTIEYEQPDYRSSIAVMLGQSGWSSRGQDWGMWDQSGRQGDFDFNLLNLFFPGIGDNWQIGNALTGKEFTGLPFGMVDVISVYAPASVMKQYDVIVGLGWSHMSDALASNIEEYTNEGGVFFSLLTFTHSNETVDDLEDPYAWTEGFASLFGVEVRSSGGESNIMADDFLHSVTFTQDTFWYSWDGKTYSYCDPDEADYWFLKFNYDLSGSENTRVIAWVDGIQSEPNAFIVENKNGAGYTYIVNTRNPNSLPDGVLTDALTDFIYNLCSYHVRPMTYLPYPETEYWLSHGQSDRAVYLRHDNSTATQAFTYYIRPLDAGLTADKDYIIFDYLTNEFGCVIAGSIVPLNVTLQSKEAKLFLLLEDTGAPQVLYSDAILTEKPTFTNPNLSVALKAVKETTNTTQIFCSGFERPTYILGTPFSIAQQYDPETNILAVVSNSNFTASWEKATDISIVSADTCLTDVSWNSLLGTLSVSATGAAGQVGSIQLQTGESTPYYVKVDGAQVSTWSYDAATGIMSANFLFTGQTVDVAFGFKPIEIDRAVVSDERADVGSVQSVSFHLMWMCNGSDVAGATVAVNGTEYVTNQTGWISFDVSSDVVGSVVWSVTGINYDGLTVYAKSVSDPFIIWDRVNVTDSFVFDDVVEVGSLQTVWLTAEYEYDSVNFDGSRGTIFLNGEPMVWSSQNLRWESTVSSDVLGLQVYEVTSVDDEGFGLTTISNQGSNVELIWDKIEITKTEFETNTLGVTSARVYVAYTYTNNPVVNATVLVNCKVCNETEPGTYTCTIDDRSPLQSFLVKVESLNFEQITQNVLAMHVMNTIVYIAIGSAVVLTAAFFVLRKKRSKQKRESGT